MSNLLRTWVLTRKRTHPDNTSIDPIVLKAVRGVVQVQLAVPAFVQHVEHVLAVIYLGDGRGGPVVVNGLSEADEVEADVCGCVGLV